MRRVGLVGIDWRRKGVAGLAPYTLSLATQARRLPALQADIGASELVYLATCNRVEVLFVTAEPAAIATCRRRVFTALRGRRPGPLEAESELTAWGGEGAVEHLIRLAAGLESAVRGESEIVGQLRRAAATAEQAGTLGPVLGWLLDEVRRLARAVRRGVSGADEAESIADLVVARLRQRLTSVPGPVALVGVSPMTVQCGRELASIGGQLTVFNRSPERSRKLAASIGARPESLETLRSGAAEPHSAIVCATGAPAPVLRRADLERLPPLPSGHLPLVIDLAVPADVDPDEAAAAGIRRVGLEELLEMAPRADDRDEEARAAALVDRALERIDERLVERTLAPMFAALQRRYRATAAEGLERLVQRHLRGLEPEQQEDLRRWGQALARRCAHIPTAGLRALAREYGFEALEAFFAQGDDRLALDLRAERTRDDHPLPAGSEFRVTRGRIDR